MQQHKQRSGLPVQRLLLLLAVSLQLAHAERRVRARSVATTSLPLLTPSLLVQPEAQQVARKLLLQPPRPPPPPPSPPLAPLAPFTPPLAPPPYFASSTDTSGKEKRTRGTAGIVVGVIVGVIILAYAVHRYRKKHAAPSYDSLTEEHATELSVVQKG